MNHLTLHVEAYVATVTLNRPEVRNAFNQEVIAEMTQAFIELGLRDDVRCVVLAASGPAFCAGADLNWMRSMADYSVRAEPRGRGPPRHHAAGTCTNAPSPSSPACRAMCTRAAPAWSRPATSPCPPTRRGYCLSEVKLGLIPATISPYVVRAMGARAAQRYFLTAERFDAAEAHRIGFVHEVVAAEALDAKVAELVKAAGQRRPRGRARLQEAGAGRGRPAPSTTRCIAEDGRGHCRHPRERRRPRGRAVLPAEAQAELVARPNRHEHHDHPGHRPN